MPALGPPSVSFSKRHNLLNNSKAQPTPLAVLPCLGVCPLSFLLLLLLLLCCVHSADVKGSTDGVTHVIIVLEDIRHSRNPGRRFGFEFASPSPADFCLRCWWSVSYAWYLPRAPRVKHLLPQASLISLLLGRGLVLHQRQQCSLQQHTNNRRHTAIINHLLLPTQIRIYPSWWYKPTLQSQITPAPPLTPPSSAA
jgi:hypothetical protein